MASLIYIDACAKCVADVSDLRDLETIKSRVKEEGVSFLTITLPKFCQDFERSLANGCIDSTFFRGFRKNGSIPAFLQGMISRIFDKETGRIYEQSSVNRSDNSIIVDSVRQICLAFKKMELSCSPKRISAALQNFVTLEQSQENFSIPKADSEYFNLVSAVLWDNILANIRLDVLLPRHGPGATAERISGNQKYAWRSWHERLEPYFPFIDSAYNMDAYQSKELEIVTFIKPEHEPPVRVVCVPKTLKSPRIIAIEPACMQYTQQAIREVLYELIESSKLTKGHINFADQTVNQELALISSKTGHLVTIDLSDASDRVPRSLALDMFRSNPFLRDAIDSCRSTHAKMPDGTVIGPLNKFASMGSALCFPIESMYFYTICVAALLKAQNLPVSHSNCYSVSRDVYVYGDDIIAPSTYATIILEYLQKYNCKVNSNKTFLTGRFRESCGVDAYDGELVTPVYLRKERPENKRQANEIISWVATANLFYKKGYWRVAQFMFNTCEQIVGPLPYVSETSSALGRKSFLGYCSVGRWNSFLHRFEVKALVPSPVYYSDRIGGFPALQKSFTHLVSRENGRPELVPSRKEDRSFPGCVSQSVSDPLHLERSALHGAVALKLRWVPAT
jgi:hypothetical protein